MHLGPVAVPKVAAVDRRGTGQANYLHFLPVFPVVLKFPIRFCLEIKSLSPTKRAEGSRSCGCEPGWAMLPAGPGVSGPVLSHRPAQQASAAPD